MESVDWLCIQRVKVRESVDESNKITMTDYKFFVTNSCSVEIISILLSVDLTVVKILEALIAPGRNATKY